MAINAIKRNTYREVLNLEAAEEGAEHKYISDPTPLHHTDWFQKQAAVWEAHIEAANHGVFFLRQYSSRKFLEYLSRDQCIPPVVAEVHSPAGKMFAHLTRLFLPSLISINTYTFPRLSLDMTIPRSFWQI